MNQFLPKSKCRTERRKLPKMKETSFLSNSKTSTYSSRVKPSKPKERTIQIDPQNFNIFHVDSQIRKKLESKISTISDLQKELGNILWILQHGENPVDQVLAKRKASIIRKQIQDLETTLELGLYLFRTSDILGEYRRLMIEAGPKSFIKEERQERDQFSLRKRELISQFLCIAQDYIDIDYLNQPLEKILCSECQTSEFRFDDENSIYVCRVCGTEVEILDDSPSFKDTDRVNMSSRFSYSRRGHFIDAMRRFQGIQNIDPKKIEKVVEVLRQEMNLHGLTEATVTKDHIYMFLSERRLSRHYEDLNLLFHIITGKPCPNISHLEDDLLNDFDRQEEKLSEVLEDERDNSLNVNYKLYKLLQRRGFSCWKDDFYILKTKTKEDEHDEAMKAAWEKLNEEDRLYLKEFSVEEPTWDWIPTF